VRVNPRSIRAVELPGLRFEPVVVEERAGDDIGLAG
jgi:hypothetical protein